MRLSLRPATLADAATITDVYFSAFSKDAISLLCFPRNNDAVYNFWYDSVVEEMNDPNSHFLCVIDEDAFDPVSSTIPLIVSYAKWQASAASVPSELPTWPEGSDVAVANHFFQNLLSKHAKAMHGRRHWYLELLATRPEYQGKGAAGKLMRYGLEAADREGVETYLEASPNGKRIYEHFGFREVDRLVVQLEGKSELGEEEFVEVMMVRSVNGVAK